MKKALPTLLVSFALATGTTSLNAEPKIKTKDTTNSYAFTSSNTQPDDSFIIHVGSPRTPKAYFEKYVLQLVDGEHHLRDDLTKSLKCFIDVSKGGEQATGSIGSHAAKAIVTFENLPKADNADLYRATVSSDVASRFQAAQLTAMKAITFDVENKKCITSSADSKYVLFIPAEIKHFN